MRREEPAPVPVAAPILWWRLGPWSRNHLMRPSDRYEATLMLLTAPARSASVCCSSRVCVAVPNAAATGISSRTIVLLEDTYLAPDSPDYAIRPVGTQNTARARWTTPHGERTGAVPTDTHPLRRPHRRLHRPRLVPHDQRKRHRPIRLTRHPPNELPDRGIDIQPRRRGRSLHLDVDPTAVLLGHDVDEIHLGAHRPPLRRQPPRESLDYASLATSHTDTVGQNVDTDGSARNPDRQCTIGRHRRRQHSSMPAQQPCGEWDAQQPRPGTRPCTVGRIDLHQLPSRPPRSRLVDAAQLIFRDCT